MFTVSFMMMSKNGDDLDSVVVQGGQQQGRAVPLPQKSLETGDCELALYLHMHQHILRFKGAQNSLHRQ